MNLTNFKLKKNSGWTSILANCNLRSLGYMTNRLAKFDNTGLIQVTIGSTLQGQACGLNTEIEYLIKRIFPISELIHTASTNGNSDKPKYPTFQAHGNIEKLNDFFNQLERLIVERS